MSSKNKVFVVGLPRTGTTSFCLAMLECGLKVAHTAYVPEAFAEADVLADTPVFCDYPQLDKDYPGAKFVMLTREPTLWVPSIQQLLLRMLNNLTRSDGGFNPDLKRCYGEIFAPLTLANIQSEDFLKACYLKHLQNVQEYFSMRPDSLLEIDVSQPHSFARASEFVTGQAQSGQFQQVNMKGKVTYWKSVRHPLKVASI